MHGDYDDVFDYKRFKLLSSRLHISLFKKWCNYWTESIQSFFCSKGKIRIKESESNYFERTIVPLIAVWGEGGGKGKWTLASRGCRAVLSPLKLQKQCFAGAKYL